MAKFNDRAPQPEDEFGWAHYGNHANHVMYAEWLSYRQVELRLQEAVPAEQPSSKTPPRYFSEDDYEASRLWNVR